MFLPLVTEVAGAVGELPVALITLDVVHEAVLPGVFRFVVRPQGLDLGRDMVTQLAEYLHGYFHLGVFVLVWQVLSLTQSHSVCIFTIDGVLEPSKSTPDDVLFYQPRSD